MKAARATQVGLARITTGVFALLASSMALANIEPQRWQLNMTPGVTRTAENAYQMHMLMLWICVAIGVIVFGAMAYAMFKFRKSKGAKPDVDFTHSTKLEIIWTVVPIIILVVMAVPATIKVIEQYDTKGHEMTVKVTGYQWMWRYEIVGEDVNFISRLDRESDRIRQSGERPTAESSPHYLREVDRVLVLPTDTKIRFVVTADDVIHAWWVPALGWKQDAIPGVINEAWTQIREPGTYRGVCAELCGKDHGFMPIVVKAVPRGEYDAWLAAQKAGDLVEAARIATTTPATAQAVGEG
ncbi:MAG: cytochrome c oxidase subunit II [Arenimonas sp.]|uniref:cytochrome c oxidase subunit II n=1 Tax=Arenimonas sp. TaxID=1872635 RepID=UPI0025BD954A|nr:cytochrome c oxidase subunit II [Arenimonas sp.]MBW8368646.1 cytochrome c oxidase subunit II [Arenimonas sp.]